jgi:hypothetical protein
MTGRRMEQRRSRHVRQAEQICRHVRQEGKTSKCHAWEQTDVQVDEKAYLACKTGRQENFEQATRKGQAGRKAIVLKRNDKRIDLFDRENFCAIFALVHRKYIFCH